MTFHPGDVQLWHKEYPMFCQWAVDKGILFLPKELSQVDEDKQYDLETRAYILMKRLRQGYTEIMQMPSSERDKFFDLEMALIKKEEEQAKQNDN